MDDLTRAKGLLWQVIGTEGIVSGDFEGIIEWVDDTYKGHVTCCGAFPDDEDHEEDCLAVAIRKFLRGEDDENL